MTKGTICCVCRSEAIRYASRYLSEIGFSVTDTPIPEAAHLLLPVPSFSKGQEFLAPILSCLSRQVVISGGNLDIPALSGYQTVDFLSDPYYLAKNAAITASCALEIVENRLGTDLKDRPVLVLGWGRIGKCLGKALQARGADVTIAARKDSDLAMIHALGYQDTFIYQAADSLSHFQVILNTVPEMLLPQMQCRKDAVILELASKPGMCGDNIISARGLPGIMAPAKSGELIARTFLRLSLGKEVIS